MFFRKLNPTEGFASSNDFEEHLFQLSKSLEPKQQLPKKAVSVIQYLSVQSVCSLCARWPSTNHSSSPSHHRKSRSILHVHRYTWPESTHVSSQLRHNMLWTVVDGGCMYSDSYLHSLHACTCTHVLDDCHELHCSPCTSISQEGTKLT